MSHRATAVGTLATGLLLSACSIFLPRAEEYRSDTYRGSYFDSIAVISGSDEQGMLQMAHRVRDRLEQEGIGIVHVRGLWPTEIAAVEGICETYRVKGVVVVVWNRLTLRECQTQSVAFDVQGEFAGAERMTGRLLGFLRKG